MDIKIAETLKILRRERGNTQEELAEHLEISVQAVSKWERSDGMPDITLLPRIASFYDTSVDFLLGCDAIKKEKDITEFKEQSQILINEGKRKESLELCRRYQKKYPNDETILNQLMHDLYMIDCKNNSDEIIAIANKLLHSDNIEYHYCALRTLSFTHSRLGNYESAVKYAKKIPVQKDILRAVLKGEELVEHCKLYFYKVCDEMYFTESCFSQCKEAGYSVQDRHKMKKAIYDIFNIVFSDGDFGFYDERLAQICMEMALCSAESGQTEAALLELEKMCEHLKRCQNYINIDHISLFVKGLHHEASQSGRSNDHSIASEFLQILDENVLFKDIKEYNTIKQKLKILV